MNFYDLIWLVPLFPLIGAVFNGLVSNRLGLEKKVDPHGGAARLRVWPGCGAGRR